MKRMLSRFYMIALILLALIMPISDTDARDTVEEPPVVIDSSSQSELSVTLYENGMNLVREVREVSLKSGLNLLYLVDIPGDINPDAVYISPLDNTFSFILVDQRYQGRADDLKSLIDSFIGMDVRILGPNFDKRGRLVKAEGIERVVVDTGTETLILPSESIAFPSIDIKPNLMPRLEWRVFTDKDNSGKVELIYSMDQLKWGVQYVAVMDQGLNTISLNGWVNITNNSGVTYRNADIIFIGKDGTRGLTSLNRITVEKGGVIQIPCLSGLKLPLRSNLVLDMNPDRPIRSLNESVSIKVSAFKYILFDNMVGGSVGTNLFEGPIRLYLRDGEGALRYIGEESIKFDPESKYVELLVGSDPEIWAERRILDYRPISENSYEAAYVIKIVNNKNQDVRLSVIENFPGECGIVESLPSLRQTIDSRRVMFPNITVERNKSKEIFYRVKVSIQSDN